MLPGTVALCGLARRGEVGTPCVDWIGATRCRRRHHRSLTVSHVAPARTALLAPWRVSLGGLLVLVVVNALLFFASPVRAQRLPVAPPSLPDSGISRPCERPLGPESGADDLFCIGARITTPALLQQYRNCSVVVGHLTLQDLELTCCDFAGVSGVAEQVNCRNLADCPDIQGWLFPLLTDVTGYVKLSNVQFPAAKNMLDQVFPVLVSVHGTAGFRLDLFFPLRPAITAFYLEWTNLKVSSCTRKPRICTRKPSRIGVSSGVNTITSPISVAVTDLADLELVQDVPAELKNNPFLCNRVPENPRNLPSFLSEKNTALQIDDKQLCSSPSATGSISGKSAGRVQFLSDLYVTSCPDLLEVATGKFHPPMGAGSVEDGFCEYNCPALTPSIAWAENLAIPCTRQCNGRTIMHVVDLVNLMGCTRINGDVTLAINTGPTYTDLEMLSRAGLPGVQLNTTLTDLMKGMFQDVVEINGDLRLLATDCIRSLDFFASLRRVGGSVHIVNNRFLSDIGHLITNNVTFSSNVTIRDNPNLCPGDVSRLRQALNLGRRLISGSNGFSAHCSICIREFSLVARTTRIDQNGVVAIQLNGTVPNVEAECTQAVLNDLYPELPLLANAIKVAIHGWFAPLYNVTTCSREDPNFPAELARVNTSSGNCTNDNEGWFGVDLADGTAPFAAMAMNYINPCDCYLAEVRATWFLPDGRVLGVARSDITLQQLPGFGRLPPISVTSVKSKNSTSLTISYVLPMLFCNPEPDFRLNYSLEVRYARSPVGRTALYAGNSICAGSVPDSVNFQWTVPASVQRACTAWPKAPSEQQALRNEDSVVYITTKSDFYNAVPAGTMTMGSLDSSAQYLVGVRYTYEGAESPWTELPLQQTWTTDSYNSSIVLEPPRLRTGLSASSTPGLPGSVDVGLSWSAVNDSAVNESAVHMYRLRLATDCPFVLGPEVSTTRAVRGAFYNSAALLRGLNAAGCQTCGSAPVGPGDSLDCYASCSPGQTCRLGNLTGLVCFCLRYHCRFSVSACSLNGTCGPPSRAVSLFDYSDACEDEALLQAAPDCIFLNGTGNSDDCLHLNSQCLLSGLAEDHGSGTPTSGLTTKERDIIIGACFATAAGLFLMVVVAFNFRKQHKLRKRITKLEIEFGADYELVEYSPDEWEIEPRNVEIHDELGEGAFGHVFKGLLYTKDANGDDSAVVVAIKTAKASEGTVRSVFLQEASIMKQFQSPHVVQLMGIVSQVDSSEEVLVLMEYMPNRDLKNYLRASRPYVAAEAITCACAHSHSTSASSHVCSEEKGCDWFGPPDDSNPLAAKGGDCYVLRWALQLAKGLSHLVERRFVHRDVSARNCMLDAHLNLKLADFGLTRDIYQTEYYRKRDRGALPIRWLPGEALRDGVYTTATDMWSYGVVLWEIATYARLPYGGMSNNDVLNYVAEDGQNLKLPAATHAAFPDLLKGIMLLCFSYVPDLRPSADRVVQYIEDGAVPDWMTFDELIDAPRQPVSHPGDLVDEEPCQQATPKHSHANFPAKPTAVRHGASSEADGAVVVNRAAIRMAVEETLGSRDREAAASNESSASSTWPADSGHDSSCGSKIVPPLQGFTGNPNEPSNLTLPASYVEYRLGAASLPTDGPDPSPRSCPQQASFDSGYETRSEPSTIARCRLAGLPDMEDLTAKEEQLYTKSLEDVAEETYSDGLPETAGFRDLRSNATL